MRKYFYPFALLLSLFVISCSASKQAADRSEPAEPSFYPSWYSATSEFTRSADSTRFSAYGMAVGADSTVAISKAVTKAKSNMEQHLSSTLESIRKEAASEHSELDDRTFVFTLRKAEAVISDALLSTQTSTRRNRKFGSYHGFAEVSISKKELIQTLDQSFRAHQGVWQAMKSSKAFQRF